jgi:hypothetical protein
MSTHYLDPSLPTDNALIVSGELRCQFRAIQDRFAQATGVAPFGLTVSNPPTQAEMQAIADKLDERCMETRL